MDYTDNPLKDQQAGYTWEEEYKRSWDTLQEDETGKLQSADSSLHKKLLLKRKNKDAPAIQRGLLRYCFIIFDCSANTSERDLRPSRIELTIQTLEAFVLEFFEQNPLSQLGLIMMRDGLAEKITDLTSNPMDLIRSLRDKKNRDSSGCMSLQNALAIAINTLRQVPEHGSREVFGIIGSLTSNDPDDITSTIADLNSENVRVSIVQMAAEVYLFKKVSLDTGGTFSVCLNEIHFRELVMAFIHPPPTLTINSDSSLVQMGFSIRIHDKVPTFCSW
ncbi:hypothetical protein BB560_006624 [Smittium megazygosporum]|uniref:VWFA domain-containing protein n=1 Tax=Smittium megazygosporum TaxID=133381 RepID=A0A2T9Y2X2_9FUNG|nr:hypothetical protein BB560_006624 [Smittium megazygosporum]